MTPGPLAVSVPLCFCVSRMKMKLLPLPTPPPPPPPPLPLETVASAFVEKTFKKPRALIWQNLCIYFATKPPRAGPMLIEFLGASG